MRTSYAESGFLLKVKKVAKTSSEKSQVKKNLGNYLRHPQRHFRTPAGAVAPVQVMLKNAKRPTVFALRKAVVGASCSRGSPGPVWVTHAALWRE